MLRSLRLATPAARVLVRSRPHSLLPIARVPLTPGLLDTRSQRVGHSFRPTVVPRRHRDVASPSAF